MKHLKLDNLIIDAEYEDLLDYDYHTFNGGEEHFRLLSNIEPNNSVIIEVSLTSSKKIMQLLIATDALKRLGIKNIHLFSPYLPYARQDRVCNKGEALSLKVMTDLINSQNYESVYVLDPHSDVLIALLNNYKEINLFSIVCEAFGISALQWKDAVLVAPDSGAIKKAYKLSKIINNIDVISCKKNRDVSTGEIKSLDLHCDSLIGKTCFIVDDICDGGRTFIEVAKKLRQKGCNDIKLFVSHGIFSKGVDVLFGKIDEIITTNSIPNDVKIGTTVDKINNNLGKVWAVPFRKEMLTC